MPDIRPTPEDTEAIQSDLADTPGMLWVERFLLPLLSRKRPGFNRETLHCLQIETIDSLDCLEEAKRIRIAGHQCDVALYRHGSAADAPDPADVQVFDDVERLPLESGKYDVILTGRLGKMAALSGRGQQLAQELARVCKPGGALLATFGNRLCPLDISGNTSILHGPRDAALLTLREAKGLLLEDTQFSAVDSVNVYGHFGWSKVGAAGRIVATGLDVFWRTLATPRNEWIYGSPLNPCFMLWVTR